MSEPGYLRAGNRILLDLMNGGVATFALNRGVEGVVPQRLRVTVDERTDEGDRGYGDGMLTHPGQTQALHSYLGEYVLPKVERKSHSGTVEFRAEGASASLSGGLLVLDLHVDEAGFASSHPSYGRALAACLLAAADEAEGVTS